MFLAGVIIPVGIYGCCESEAKLSNLDSIVRKNLRGLSNVDCGRLTTALAWTRERRIPFDLDNDNLLRGVFP